MNGEDHLPPCFLIGHLSCNEPIQICVYDKKFPRYHDDVDQQKDTEDTQPSIDRDPAIDLGTCPNDHLHRYHSEEAKLEQLKVLLFELSKPDRKGLLHFLELHL